LHAGQVTAPTLEQRYPLGRRVEHDPASRQYRAVEQDPDLAALPRKVNHRHYYGVLNQGKLGGCVGWTGADALNTAPLRHTGERWSNADGLDFYRGATRNDQWPGNDYPPNDEGSSGLGLGKYLTSRGLITGYTWTFSWPQFLTALAKTPMCVGIGWTSSMFTPDKTGLVTPTGPDVGGHEFMVHAYDMDAPGGGRVKALNHWTKTWGAGGYFYLTFDAMAERLANQGDAMRLQR
jgi:hypothetical protein